ncbi:lipid A biosynthesis acyltransferase [Poseidonibacter lekithochrous]|uniref:LpxL/LpxP family acyltransferase n=1 Tax=Poseidonibacter TaxID=2321187 RepID=UPI001C08F3FE|nr:MULTISPECIES: lipid A biosynthesis acyltransferase [Poseidonibacter]MBU3014484.1 lipid A biosynthesis acyltransferase [Poseidonibacter lekithochrous]MDO6827782.1 lipid A biosynthesis acyltransferase [Poseidonibacter sp. 1_MG-2023]
MKVKQRGSGWSIKLVFNLYKLFGYKFTYYLMYPVSFFYFLFASNVKKALKDYYSKLNKPFNNWIYFNHLRVFSICMVDRFISKHDPSSYNFIYHEKEKVENLLDTKTILLFSHFGGWAASSNNPITKNKVNIVMQEVILDSIKDIENSIEKSVSNTHIIDQSEGQLSVSIEIANAISNNEVIAIMTDRPTSKKYKYKINFFNKDAYFNINPFKIAYRTKTPMLACFTILTGLQEYTVKTITINLDFTLNQNEALDKAINEYTKEFESILIKYPNQWFNFYNFWEK